MARGGLCALSGLYAAGIKVRNAYYDRFSLPIWLDVPVISVGNLTVGGTGKTPMSIWLCERMLERGLKPAVLSRGYKGSAESGADELLLVSRRVPKAVVVANPDRAKAGELAITEYDTQVAVLDDGFQHRRLGRDLDIVLIDATQPFGYGHVLPRGLLREPLTGLRRAEAVVITRCDQVRESELVALEANIRQIHPDVPVVRSVHRPKGFVDLHGGPVAEPGKRIGAFAGIARPEAFLRSAASVGYVAVDHRWWPDHHAYTPQDVQSLAQWARDAGFDALVTTEKDAVKLAKMPAEWPVPVVALRVEIEMLDDGDKILGQLIDRMLADHEGDE